MPIALNTATLITFIAYLLGMLGIGYAAYRATNNLSDYILGGRRLGSGVAALSAGASDMSGWLLLGLPGAIYAGGLSQAWIGIGLLIGAYANWKIVAPRLRIYTEQLDDSLTLPDYFERRFGDGSHALRVLTAAIILLFFVFYTASGMVAGAKLFESSFGMDYTQALWIGAGVIVSYTFMGGFLAVSWTDFVQGILMLLALIVAPLVVWYELGSLDAIISATKAVSPARLDPMHEVSLVGLLSLFAWGLGYAGQPHVLARFMAVRSAATVAPARRIAMSWMSFSLLGAMITGFIGIAYFVGRPEQASLLAHDPEKVFILLSQIAFNPWIAGMLLAAILAAVMSTIDSQLLVSSSALTEDFYKVFLHRDAGQAELVLVGRIGVLVLALLAVSIAYDPNSVVLALVSYAWAGLGAAFGPVVWISLLWSGMTRKGALSGMIAGATTVIVWSQLHGGWFDLYELLPGFVVSCVAVVAVSRFEHGPDAATRGDFARISKMYP